MHTQTNRRERTDIKAHACARMQTHSQRGTDQTNIGQVLIAAVLVCIDRSLIAAATSCSTTCRSRSLINGVFFCLKNRFQCGRENTDVRLSLLLFMQYSLKGLKYLLQPQVTSAVMLVKIKDRMFFNKYAAYGM